MKYRNIYKSISVIIPTYNSGPLLIRCLQALEANKYPRDKLEVIIVDDGSNDDTHGRVLRFKKTSPMALHYLSQSNAGAGAARNLGIEHTQGNIVAFTDADCIPDRNWLSTINDYFLTNVRTVVGGHTYCNQRLIFPWIIAPAGQQGITANLAIRKKDLRNIRFDHSFAGILGEDTDLIFRLEDSGIIFSNCISMRVQHPPNILKLRGLIRRALARKNEVGLFKKYGYRTKDSMHPLFRPVLFKSISPIAIVTILFIILIFNSFGNLDIAVSVFAFILVASIYFILHGYSFLVTNSVDGLRLNIKLRIKTFLFLIIYFLCYFLGRISGSIKYRKLVI